MGNDNRNGVIPEAVPQENRVDTDPVGPKKRPVRLRSARDTRKFLAKIANQLYRGEIQEGRAGRLAYILTALLRSIETDVLERRIEELEQRLEGRR